MPRVRLLVLGGTVVLVVVLFLVLRPDDASEDTAATTAPTPTRSVSSPSSSRPTTSAAEPEPSGSDAAFRLQPRSHRSRVCDRPLLLARVLPGAMGRSARERPARAGVGPLRVGGLRGAGAHALSEHDLVRPGRRARLRARDRAGARARSRGGDLPDRVQRDPRPVLAPRAHGPLHGRWFVDPFSGLGGRAHPAP